MLALYRRYLEEGDRFVPRYIDLLSEGGSGTPDELLSRVGIDLRTANFWQQGFDTLADLISEFSTTI